MRNALAEVSTEQRVTSYDAEHHSAVNRVFVDDVQHLDVTGGHVSFLPDEQFRLEADGICKRPLSCGIRSVSDRSAAKKATGASPLRPAALLRRGRR